MIKNRIGYSFWGFLADVKMNKEYEEISTPDGNAFYSWSIIRELQKRGYEVVSIMPDRDKYAVEKLKDMAFNAWATKERYEAYFNMNHIEYEESNLIFENEKIVFNLWDELRLYNLDYIIHEWRMKIPGRNDVNLMVKESKWQPDYFLQKCLIKYCIKRNIKLFIFDLDYKLSEEIVDLLSNKDITILELGDKWKNILNTEKVYIPFSFDKIDNFVIKPVKERSNNLVYVGNRYERDWCIDKYFPEYLSKCSVYGNWKESGRDSETKWPYINFKERLQTKDMYDVYSNSVCTILFAKEEYCKYGFMTARVIESVFYGTIPLFIREYGEDVIKEYAGEYASLLTVNGKEDVADKILFFKYNELLYNEIILYLRKRLSFMDVNNFVQVLEDIVF